jgi:hypothetical protein
MNQPAATEAHPYAPPAGARRIDGPGTSRTMDLLATLRIALRAPLASARYVPRLNIT